MQKGSVLFQKKLWNRWFRRIFIIVPELEASGQWPFVASRWRVCEHGRGGIKLCSENESFTFNYFSKRRDIQNH